MQNGLTRGGWEAGEEKILIASGNTGPGVRQVRCIGIFCNLRKKVREFFHRTNPFLSKSGCTKVDKPIVAQPNVHLDIISRVEGRRSETI